MFQPSHVLVTVAMLVFVIPQRVNAHVIRVDMIQTVQVRFHDTSWLERLKKLQIIHNLYLIYISTEFDCPGGTDQGCSNQGSCDDTTGICICNSGFEGASCHLSISKVIYSVIILKIYMYRSQLLILSYF